MQIENDHSIGLTRRLRLFTVTSTSAFPRLVLELLRSSVRIPSIVVVDPNSLRISAVKSRFVSHSAIMPFRASSFSRRELHALFLLLAELLWQRLNLMR